jgi:hypothetical protein
MLTLQVTKQIFLVFIHSNLMIPGWLVGFVLMEINQTIAKMSKMKNDKTENVVRFCLLIWMDQILVS